MTTQALTDVERTRLTEERDHLLASLDDLDAERAAADIDEDDYLALRDDYTARAAQLTRAIEGATVRRTKVAAEPASRRLLWLGAVIAIAAVASWAMVQFSGARGTSDTASGEIRSSTVSLLNDAAQEFRLGNVDRSIELYGEVLEIQPTNVEALTYRGWIQYQSGDVDAAADDFDEAVAYDPAYADVRVFRAIAALDAERYEEASAELVAFDAAEPTQIAQSLVAQRQVRERIGVARMAEVLDEVDGAPDLDAANIGIAEAQLAGELFVQLEDPERAIRSFDAVLGSDPTNADAMAWHGWTLALVAESGVEELFPDAVEWLDRAVAADPESADALVFRAFVFNRLDRGEDASDALAAFDALTDQPADMVSLIEQFDLRSAVS